MTLTNIDQYKFNELLNKSTLTIHEKNILASYPYVSLSTYCHKEIYKSEIADLRKLEDLNIWNLLKFTGLLFGIGSEQELNLLNQSFMKEPLKSAVIAARQISDPNERIIVFIEYACKILLSIDKKGTTMFNAINVSLEGKMPFRFTSKLSDMGNEWFRNFVELKFAAMRKIFLQFGTESAYPFFIASVMHSLYYFNPNRYNIYWCTSEDEALHKIFKEYTNIIANYKYKKL